MDAPTRAEVEELAAKIARDVAELPDRTSPPDEPMLLLVTERELIDIVQHRLDEAYAATLDAPQAEPEKQMTEDQIKYMVDRFLGWRLPENFSPDAGISFERFGNKDTPHQYEHRPSGTNLLDADQATAMVRYMLEGLPSASQAAPEGKPTPEMRDDDIGASFDVIRSIAGSDSLSIDDENAILIALSLIKSHIDMLAAAAQKAALEAEARCAEMREALDWTTAAIRHYQNALSILGTIIDGKTLFEHSPSQNTECLLAWQKLDAAGKKAQLALRKADVLPNPSGDRFMALLEAMERIRVDCETSPKRYSDADCRQRCAIIAHEALSLFQQPEEQP